MNNYKQLRILSDLTRKDAANLLGISWYYLRNIENGQRIPGRNILVKMSALYKCSLEELLKAC